MGSLILYDNLINQSGKTLIIIKSQSIENFFSDLIGDSPLSSIEFFEDLSDDYNFDRTWDVPDQWIWKFDSPKDLDDLIKDYNLPENDLIYV
jgi:hypothetical protein